jgi:glycosyltransferase involved in cell wall biosynthesis
MRREHHLAMLAASNGHDVRFIEQAGDIRSAGRSPLTYARGFSHPIENEGALSVVRRSVIVPGHRGELWRQLEARQLGHVLRQPFGPEIYYLPWQFGAGPPGVAKVFDCTDDWLQLYPEQAEPLLRRSFARIADEADEIIVVSPDLSSLFPGRAPTVIPNGVDERDVVYSVKEPRRRNSLVFIGTLSERFDLDLVHSLLRELPEWTLDLYGPCRYSGSGDAPSHALRQAIETSEGRMVLHGPVPKSAVAGILDDADVLIIPNRSGFSRGQSSMKLFDAAARGRPAVVAPDVTVDGVHRPPKTYVAEHSDHWATQVLAAAGEPSTFGEERRQWALANTWQERWHQWANAVGLSGQGRGRIES